MRGAVERGDFSAFTCLARAAGGLDSGKSFYWPLAIENGGWADPKRDLLRPTPRNRSGNGCRISASTSAFSQVDSARRGTTTAAAYPLSRQRSMIDVTRTSSQNCERQLLRREESLTSWLTTHYPHPRPDDHPWHIYLQRQHREAALPNNDPLPNNARGCPVIRGGRIGAVRPLNYTDTLWPATYPEPSRP
jgi:hypothetical protein